MNRYGLSIGVSAYHEPKHCLDNPRNDATLVAHTLQTRGFEVDLQLDADLSAIESSLQTLRHKVDAAASRGEKAFTVIYFAGHAVEVNGASFMLPADFPEWVSPSTLGLRAFSAPALTDAIVSCPGPKIIIIDACRVPTAIWEPYEVAQFSDLVSEQRQTYPRSDEVHDLLIAFSTSPGSEAGDGLDGHSVYCGELCKALLRHDLSVEEVFSWVGQQVITKTEVRQRPWYLSSLTRRAAFTDLSSYRLICAAPTGRAVFSRSRIFARAMDDSVIYHDERAVFQIRQLEGHKLLRFEKNIAAVAVHDEHFFVVDADGKLHFIWGDSRPAQEAQIDCNDVLGIEVAPKGDALAVFGTDGYVVFVCVDGVWRVAWTQCRLRWSVFGAAFRDGDSLFLCGSIGTLRQVSHLRTNPTCEDLKTNTHSPIYDLEILGEQELLAACCAQGRVRFFDLTKRVLVRETDLGVFGKSLPGAYDCLRDIGLSGEQALEFLEDPEDVRLAGYVDSDGMDLVVRTMPSNDLLCCAITRDPRVIAVGSGDGFIYLIDTRDGELFCTLDAGGSRGVNLQWLRCSTLDGSLSALSSDGVMLRFGRFHL